MSSTSGECPSGQASLSPTTTDLCLFYGFGAGKIDEVTYTANNPIIVGLAYALPRDVGSFLRFQLRDDAGIPNPLALAGDRMEMRVHMTSIVCHISTASS